MLRLLTCGLLRLSSNRKQNFFQQTPIYPDLSSQDFDIYNIHKNHIFVSFLSNKQQQKRLHLKEMLRDQLFVKANSSNTWKDVQEGRGQFDQETGFPLGIHQDFDDFIAIYKKEKKVGSNINAEFQTLLLSLMKQYQVKSQIQLIRIFRINLANMKKNGFKDRIRGLLMNEAFLRFIKQRKLRQTPLNFTQIQAYFDLNKQIKRQKKEPQTASVITRQQLQQLIFTKCLLQLDKKIMLAQKKLRNQSIQLGTYTPLHHPEYGTKIEEQHTMNVKYDMKFQLGNAGKQVTTEPTYTQSQAQDRYISSKINKLYFLRVLSSLQNNANNTHSLASQHIITQQQLPMHIRGKDKVINALLHKYKEYQLFVEPDLDDIYQEIDVAMKKIRVKVVPHYIKNQNKNNEPESSSSNKILQRRHYHCNLLWQKLDIQQIFQHDNYSQQTINNIQLNQKDIVSLSPSAILELSLNKLPFNLYRHADCQYFGVFTKYKSRIYKDFMTDKVIDPELQFKFFSLEQAKRNIKKIKRTDQLPNRYYGFAKRKTSQAQVFLSAGAGKITINSQPLQSYFGDVYHRGQALKPLIFTQTAGQWDVQINVVGGGIHGQSECIAIAMSKALIVVNGKFKQVLAGFGLLGPDDRKKERKKIGKYSARASPPFVRR